MLVLNITAIKTAYIVDLQIIWMGVAQFPGNDHSVCTHEMWTRA